MPLKFFFKAYFANAASAERLRLRVPGEHAYLQVDSYRHLGDDLFYAALKYDFKGGVGSEDVYILIADDYTHVVVEKTGAKFGFTLLLKIKAEDELLRENIKCPSDMEKMKKVSNRNYGK